MQVDRNHGAHGCPSGDVEHYEALVVLFVIDRFAPASWITMLRVHHNKEAKKKEMEGGKGVSDEETVCVQDCVHRIGRLMD